MDIDSPMNGVKIRTCLICQDEFKPNRQRRLRVRNVLQAEMATAMSAELCTADMLKNMSTERCGKETLY